MEIIIKESAKNGAKFVNTAITKASTMKEGEEVKHSNSFGTILIKKLRNAIVLL